MTMRFGLDMIDTLPEPLRQIGHWRYQKQLQPAFARVSLTISFSPPLLGSLKALWLYLLREKRTKKNVIIQKGRLPSCVPTQRSQSKPDLYLSLLPWPCAVYQTPRPMVEPPHRRPTGTAAGPISCVRRFHFVFIESLMAI